MLVLSNAKNVIKNTWKKRTSNGAVRCMHLHIMNRMIYGGAVVTKEKTDKDVSLESTSAKTMKMMMTVKKDLISNWLTSGATVAKRLVIPLKSVLEIQTSSHL